MSGINIKKYKSTGSNFLSRLIDLDVFSVIRFFIGAFFIWSLMYFSGLGFARNFIVIAGMAVIGVTSLMSIVFNDGFRLPKTPVMYALLGFVGAVILSGLFTSGTLQESFIGFGVETDTVMFIALWTGLVAIIASVVHSNKQIFHLLSLVMIASGLTVLFYIVNNLIFSGAVSFTVDPMTVGILSVVLVVLTAFVRQFFVQLCNHNILFNVGTAAVGIIGAVGLFIIHDFILWVIVGIVSLVSVAYALIKKIQSVKVPTPWASIMLFFVVLVGLFIGGLQQNMQDVSGSIYHDRPSFSSTMNVTRDALLNNPIFGSGVHTFTTLWDQEKPLQDIVSQRSHVQYGFGFGYFPTFIATTGIVGLIALVTLFFFFITLGTRIIVQILRSKKDDPLTLIAWMLAFVMLVVSIMTVGDITVILLTAVSFGLALSSSVVNGHLESYTPHVFFARKKIPYTFIATIILLIILICMLFVTARSFVAAQKYRSVVTQPVGQLSSINSLIQITEFRSHDAYYRALSSQYTSALVGRVQSNETTREQVQVLVDGALNAVKSAIEYNPNNYTNYLRAAEVYGQLGLLGVEGAYGEAEQSYKIALKRKPYSVDVLISMSKLYLNQGDLDSAKRYVQVAYNVSPAQPGVYITSAQIALAEDDAEAASVYLSQAARIEPLNPRRWVDLGVVLFSSEQYAASAESFSRAIAITPNQELYYYLGLSLKELGRTQDADAIYDLLEKAGTELPIDNLKTLEPAVSEILEEEVEE